MKHRAIILSVILSFFVGISSATYAGEIGKVKELTEKNFNAAIESSV